MAKNWKPSFTYLFLFIFIILVYHIWILNLSIITSGDWPFFFQDTMNSLRIRYFSLWLPDLSFGRVLLDVGQAPTYFLYGIFSKYFGLEYNISERLIHLWPIVIFNVLGSYLILKKNFKNNYAVIIGIIVFSFNTYSLTLQTGHITLAAAYAFAPLILIFFIKTLEEKKYFLAVNTGLLSFIASSYEPRAFYIIAWVLFFYFLYHIFIVEEFSLKKLLESSFFAFIPILIMVLLSFYWLFGLLNMEALSHNEIFNRGLFGNNFWNIFYSLTLYHPWWSDSGIKTFENQPIPFYFWLIPIFAFLGLFLNRKDKLVAFFGFISLLGILLSKQVGQPLPDLYPWLYENFPGFNAFREASKFYFLIALGYSVLIASLVEWLWRNWIEAKWQIYGKYFLTLLIAFIFLWNTTPIINGEIHTLFVPRHTPEDYLVLENFILDQDEYFRTFWIPRDSRWGIYTDNHPKISDADVIYSDWKDFTDFTGQIWPLTDIFKRKYSNQLFDISSIKYVVIPIRDKENDDDFFIDYGGRENPEIRNYFMAELAGLDYLKKINIGTKDLVVYENYNYRPHIYLTFEKETIYQYIPYQKVDFRFNNPTEYEISLKNITKPVYINFAESYHPDWKLRAGNFNWFEAMIQNNYSFPDENHIKNDAGLNSFFIDPEYICKSKNGCIKNSDGSIDADLTLYFKSQSYFYIGLIISGIVFVGCIGFIISNCRRKNKN